MSFFDRVLHYFYEISAIPRASYHEDKIADYLVSFADARGLSVMRDSCHNVLIRKAASKKYESAPAVLLQGHTDMVCEKNADCIHDFSNEGIQILRDGDFLYADGTTLGADNGYAVAAMLAILENTDVEHPALECLFTSAEEVGLDGMRAVDPAWLNARLMINLDSCDERCATAACAGGVRTNFQSECRKENHSGKVIRVFVTGLCGGHSGENINQCRANALKIAARLLETAGRSGEVRLIKMDGGNKDNAIPRECEMLLAVSDPALVINAVNSSVEILKAEMCPDDAGFQVIAEIMDYQGECMSTADTRRLMNLIRILPYGPITMSAHLAGLVETSSNPAVVHADAQGISLTSSSRSSVESRLDDVCGVLEACADSCGFSYEHKSRYPGWSFRDNSVIQSIYKEASRACFGEEGKIIGIHAGLECGLLSEKIPDMDMLSIGPDMYDIHTPKEKMSVSSAERMFNLVLDILGRIQ